jgi:phosphopantothenoylcysteine decarboxylase/phosphopantothenate--cysteine ligase
VRPFDGRTVLLGVTGGIASYKSAWLARLLTKASAQVDVVLTRSATEFISAITFEALTGRPVHTGLFDAGRALDHIKLAKSAEAVVVAPATADFLARAATGQADDLLTAVLLATKAPVLLVPAMNDHMWSHPQTQRNVQHLRSIGYRVLDPEEGLLAAGEGEGPGRMPEPETVLAHVGRLVESSTASALGGRRVVVTAGPTREAIDPVRFLSNHSSGKMGVALASSAWRRGADVSLIAGPMTVAAPPGPDLRRVETTEEMAQAVEEMMSKADVLIMAAAPADFRPVNVATSKRIHPSWRCGIPRTSSGRQKPSAAPMPSSSGSRWRRTTRSPTARRNCATSGSISSS